METKEFDIERLRNIIRKLQKENRALKSTLNEAGIPFENYDFFNEEAEDFYDIDQSDRVIEKEINLNTANYFFSMFWGRQDVYALRAKSGNYYPQCENRWNDICPIKQGTIRNCDDCRNKSWKPINKYLIKKHLDGDLTVGIYPLFPDNTCRFLVFDFDNHEKGAGSNNYGNKDDEWKREINSLRKICEINDISCLVERSRSGKGGHLWIFFSEPVASRLARNFGFLLIDKGMTSVNLRTFSYYDRMYPSQDECNGLGNLIALPLQKKALEEGNTAFVDENFNAYPDQWDILLNKTRKISRKQIEEYMLKWQKELAEEKGHLTGFGIDARVKPWRRNEKLNKNDVSGKMHLVLSNGIYVDTLNLAPMIQNQIRSFAAFDNPVYYRNKNLGLSNYYNLSSIYLGKDIDGYIRIPRGLKNKIINECEKAGIEYVIEDERVIGRPIRVDFKGDLRTRQDLAANDLYNAECGILDAATGFGKTVVATYLISKRKVNTLIIIQNNELLKQWKEAFEKFLDIKEDLPAYKTKSGKNKTRDSVIGELHSGKNSLTGIIDIAMVGSLYKKGEFNELINSYGMVIIDECHHSASNTFVEVLNKIDAKYVYGFTATTKRSDQKDKVNYMLIGPVLHEYSALQRSKDNGIKHYVIPRFTRVVDTGECKDNINKAYELVCFSRIRNEQITDDVISCYKEKHNILILTRHKKHVENLEGMLKESAENIFTIYGNNSEKENREAREKISELNENDNYILIATASKVGEGFDMPSLDVLVLASPVSHESRLTQYVGRIDRVYRNKKAVYVYDYVDSHIPVFENMYRKRLKTYKKIGFSIYQGDIKEKQNVGAIYDSGNYMEIFERDVFEAEKRIIVSTGDLSREKVNRFISLVKEKQESGINITVITNEPDNSLFNDPDLCIELIARMCSNGITVRIKETVEERFAIIDDELLWHGGANLLGKEDVYDNLIRLRDRDIVAELLEISFNKKSIEDWSHFY